ncbi:hypothetical protein QR680_007420 [Steinernema hermaphroditum]|uniref:Uncharacterized protein n=1 Tax=Steinernema hermaphroditum TaxID=289476 RepID=A0AA39IFB4_9BILA|nr:hypothetical protein QR680_007420 [Steinernema hermaphroditum]
MYRGGDPNRGRRESFTPRAPGHMSREMNPQRVPFGSGGSRRSLLGLFNGSDSNTTVGERSLTSSLRTSRQRSPPRSFEPKPYDQKPYDPKPYDPNIAAALRSPVAPQLQNRTFVDRHQPESSFTLASLLTKTKNRFGGQETAPPVHTVVPHNAEPHCERFLPTPMLPFMKEGNDARGGRGGCSRGGGRGGRGNRGGGRGSRRGSGSTPPVPSPNMVHASSLGGPVPSNYEPVACFSFESLVRSPAPVAKEVPVAFSSSAAVKEPPKKRPVKPTVRYFF